MTPDDGPASAAEGGASPDGTPDKIGIELGKEIFNLLSHAVTSLKLYPPQHATVVKFVDELYAKLRAYFDGREILEVDVQERAFLMEGETVFEDEHLARSLPYLFHKDGTQKLAILKDIDRHELDELLDVTGRTSLLPLDESDIVIAIWEKDFANVRIFAPDEYLLSKIDIFTREPFEFFVDRKKLYSGRIELSADDLKDIESQKISLGLMEQEEGKDFATLVTELDDEDSSLIETVLAEARRSPPEMEFHEMIFELLTIEDRPERIVPILGFLDRHHRELVQQGKFSHAVQLLRQTGELRGLFVETQPEKAAELAKFLHDTTGGRTADLVRESIARLNFDSLSSLLEYLGFFGGRSVPLASELLDENQEPWTRRAAIDFLEEMSQDQPDILAGQLRGDKPAITREIIALLGRLGTKKALRHLAALGAYANKDVRRAAVETLGSSPVPLAQRILFDFLQDRDEDVSSAAADRLRWPGDEDILKRAIKMSSSRRFQRRGPKLKLALMNFLVRTGTSEALGAVRKAATKRSLFASASRQLTKLCAMEALARAGTPAAADRSE